MNQSIRSTEGAVFFRYQPLIAPDETNKDFNPSQERKDFETFFSQAGPLKKCSIIRSKPTKTILQRREDGDGNNGDGNDGGRDGNDSGGARTITMVGKSLGYGFCRYLTKEDANVAIRCCNGKVERIDGKQVKIIVELAGGSNTGGDSSGGVDASKNKVGEDYKQKRRLKQQQQKEKEKEFLKKVTNNNDKETTAIVTTTASKNDKDSSKSKQEEEDEEMQIRRKKTSRVIIRNLSFYATESHIRNTMQEQFGPVVDINLPLVPSSSSSSSSLQENNKFKKKQHRGFAFVTFDKIAHAKLAVSAEKVMIKNRAVAIDFSMSKMEHQKVEKERKELLALKNNNDDDDDDDGSENDSEKGDDDDNDSDEDGSSDDNSDDNSDSDNDSSDGSSDDDSDDDSKDSNDSSESSDDENNAITTTKNSNPKYEIFLRNLPFDATRHDLFLLFKEYGRIHGIFLVMDKETGAQRGTAFIKFENEGGRIRALEAATGAGAGAGGEISGETGDDNGMDDNYKNGFITGKDNNYGTGSGIHLRGRRIFVDAAVSTETADSLKVERDSDGKPITNTNKIGKDKRNLYLKNEGYVAGADGGGTASNTWDDLPMNDQRKRGKAHQEKHTKLRSPLFFINPFRLSIRNLSKDVNEAQLKGLMVKGLMKGLERNLASEEDVVTHWRAGGEMSARDIMNKINSSKNGKEDEDENESSSSTSIIPEFNEKTSVKKYIPSVFIHRDFDAGPVLKKVVTDDIEYENDSDDNDDDDDDKSKQQQKQKSTSTHELQPSRGFGFVEFTNHGHALACLRELNNNNVYSSEYVAGGRGAMEMKKRSINNALRRKKRKNDNINNNNNNNDNDTNNGGGGGEGNDFMSEDGRVRVPRLIVEFAIENKAKARLQADNKEKQLANAKMQKVAARAKAKLEKKEGGGNNGGTSSNNNNSTTTPKSRNGVSEDTGKGGSDKGNSNSSKKGRGAVQREKKRKRMLESNRLNKKDKSRNNQDDNEKEDDQQQTNNDRYNGRNNKRDQEELMMINDGPKKKIKNRKKVHVMDKEDRIFEDMVSTYKASFSSTKNDAKGARNNTNNKDGTLDGKDSNKSGGAREGVVKKRWFD